MAEILKKIAEFLSFGRAWLSANENIVTHISSLLKSLLVFMATGLTSLSNIIKWIASKI